MTIVGIVGDTGPESTIEYDRLIDSGCRTRRPAGVYPSIVIDSIDMTRLSNAIEVIGGDLAAADYLTADSTGSPPPVPTSRCSPPPAPTSRCSSPPAPDIALLAGDGQARRLRQTRSLKPR